MPLGTKVDLRAGHIVLDGFPGSVPRKAHSIPLLDPCLLWPRSPISAIAEFLKILAGVKSKTSGSGLSKVQGQYTGRGVGTKAVRSLSILASVKHYFVHNYGCPME